MKKTLLEIGKPAIIAFKVELTLEGQVGLKANNPYSVRDQIGLMAILPSKVAGCLYSYLYGTRTPFVSIPVLWLCSISLLYLIACMQTLTNMFNSRWESYGEGSIRVDITFTLFKQSVGWYFQARGIAYASLDGNGKLVSRAISTQCQSVTVIIVFAMLHGCLTPLHCSIGVDTTRNECGDGSTPLGLFLTIDLQMGTSGMAKTLAQSPLG
jgi:hypothetical protein